MPLVARRYLALFLPWLSAERAIRSGIAPPDAPLVFTEKQRGALRIVTLNGRAAALGLVPGFALADARARVPELTVLAHDPQADARLLAQLAGLCNAFTPSVAIEPPQGIMLDIGGCAALFGGEEGLRLKLVTTIAKKGVTAQYAMAETPDAARALARFGAAEIASLPLAALAVEAETRLALHRAGFHRIGDLLALPRAPLAARFGTGLVRLLARLSGEENPHITPRQTPESITAEQRFAEPVGHSDIVLDGISKLVAQVAAQLAIRHQGGRAFLVQLHRSDGHVASLTIETGAPTRDPAIVCRLLRERIDSLADPLDPGFGYDSITLTVPKVDPLGFAQNGLTEPEARVHGIDPLLDRLGVRYGAQAVRRFAPGDSHIPERAGGLLPLATAPPHNWPPPIAGEPPQRPLRLTDPPERIEVLAAVPDGPPKRFRWKGKTYLVVREEGPERIAAEWWRRHGDHDDNPGLTRDYYRVEDDAGHRFWLFRHGLYGAESVDPLWYLHGQFA